MAAATATTAAPFSLLAASLLLRAAVRTPHEADVLQQLDTAGDGLKQPHQPAFPAAVCSPRQLGAAAASGAVGRWRRRSDFANVAAGPWLVRQAESNGDREYSVRCMY